MEHSRSADARSQLHLYTSAADAEQSFCSVTCARTKAALPQLQSPQHTPPIWSPPRAYALSASQTARSIAKVPVLRLQTHQHSMAEGMQMRRETR